MYAQAVEVTGWDYQRLADTKYVALHVEFSFRNENLSWTHHRHVASLPKNKPSGWNWRLLTADQPATQRHDQGKQATAAHSASQNSRT